MRIILLLIAINFFICAHGQKDRYRFAVSYFGVENEFIYENNSYQILNSNGQIESKDMSSSLSPRILIGGTHFWGHADFYLSIPTSSLKLKSDSRASSSNGVLTGFRLIPYKLKSNRFSPYLGVGFNAKSYNQEGPNGQGPIYTNWQWYQEAGLTYVFKGRNLIDLGVRYFNRNTFNVYFDRASQSSIETSPFSFSLAYKKAFDFTSGYSTEKSKKYMKRVLELGEKEKAFSAFSFGFGLSALIPIGRTELASNKAFFNDEIQGNVTIDLGVAYHFHRYKTSVRFSYRPLKQEETAFDYLFRLRKNSYAFEAFHFFADYHGFVPFIGPYLSYDRYSLKEQDFGRTVTNVNREEIGYGLVFGWDIQQSKLDFLTLRTNLRITPEFNYKHNGLGFTSTQIEFNFIQLVFYPERFKVYKQVNL